MVTYPAPSFSVAHSSITECRQGLMNSATATVKGTTLVSADVSLAASPTSLGPFFQLDELTVSLRLVAELPQSAR
jgi:hypothetical protein